MEALIHYFTGTGNTKKIAEAAAEGLNESGYDCRILPLPGTDGNPIDNISTECSLFGLAFPTYALCPPKAVRKYLKQLPKTKGTPAFILANAHSNSGKTGSDIAAILERKGYKVVGITETLTPSNSIITEDTEDPDTAKTMMETALEKSRQFGRSIAVGEAGKHQGRLTGKQRMVSMLFKVAMPGMFLGKISVSDACHACGTCAKACPNGNIRMEEGRPVWGKACEVCLRCINICPIGHWMPWVLKVGTSTWQMDSTHCYPGEKYNEQGEEDGLRMDSQPGTCCFYCPGSIGGSAMACNRTWPADAGSVSSGSNAGYADYWF
jgi:flavodoxin/Pyruvate/2-oxoacid:ferredoxin oxidoreductase delta subunit